VPIVVVVLELVVVVALVLVLLDIVAEEVLVELVVEDDVVVEVVDDDIVVVGKVGELVEVVEVEESVEVDVVEKLVVEEEELELVLAVAVVLVETAVVVEEVLVEVVLVVVPTGADPRSTLIRPDWIWPAMKLPVRFAPSTIRSVAPGAQRCALMWETRPNVTWFPPTKRLRSRAARPDASSMVALWPMLRFPSTSTRAADSTSSAASRAARRLQNT